ncbi:hypothetical protein RD792_010965 [Penstemon davidsonii]|uniref:Membrin n=1 Tax=Penstemon davidsonii TaxID=160366 RepID=A0ABR0D395_9LAMI|nr:hypothetical protein RD792_010965 [Penstemon davidsonii]
MAVESVGGETISELYNILKRLSMKTRDALERLERLEYTSSSSSLMSSSSSVVVSGSSDDLASEIRRDIILWRSIASTPQRDLSRRKVEQIIEEAESFRASLDKYVSLHQKRTVDSHVLRIFDNETQAVESFRRLSRLLEDAFATGVAVLSKYSEQRDHLKRDQRKALNVLNTLGLSNSLLRLIERRDRFDKWIKYPGMLFTIIILIVFWRWTR